MFLSSNNNTVLVFFFSTYIYLIMYYLAIGETNKIQIYKYK